MTPATNPRARARLKKNKQSQPIPTLTALGLTALTKESAACIVHFLGVTSVESSRARSRAVRATSRVKRLGVSKPGHYGGFTTYYLYISL